MNLKLIEKIKKFPIVDKNLLMKHFDYSEEYAYLVLQRLTKRSIINKVIKGKYSTNNDIYVTLSNIYYPSYISFLTASMLKKSTEQIINTIQIICNYNKSIVYENYNVEFIKIKKLYIFGYSNHNNIFIADNEKLLIDMLLYRNYSGNFIEIIKVVKNLNFEKNKIINYLKIISNKALIKRTGFVLEKYKNIDIIESFNIDNNYIFLDLLNIKSQKNINTKWRIKHD